MDVVSACEALLQSFWLLPLLVVGIAADGPLPVLPTETVFMSAATLAAGTHDAAMFSGLFVAAVVGSVLGDLAVFGLGRSSRRMFAGSVDMQCALGRWVRRHLLQRPGVTLVGARFVPAGRLLSTAAAGRYGLPLRRFLPWSVVSSATWAGYMLAIGFALGPLTGGSPLLSLLAGILIAALTAAAFEVVRRVRAHRSRSPRLALAGS